MKPRRGNGGSRDDDDTIAMQMDNSSRILTFALLQALQAARYLVGLDFVADELMPHQ